MKTIGAVCSRYPRGNRDKAVDRRAGLLQAEYVRKVAKVDQQVLGIPRGEVGPLQRKLQSFGDIMGLVVGAFGEGSQDLHELVHTMARSRLRGQGLKEGREGSDAELGVITGQVRRSLSTSFIRANSLCLLAHLDKMGEGQQAAGKRRQYAMRVKEQMRAERASQWLAHVKLRGANRRGQFLIP